LRVVDLARVFQAINPNLKISYVSQADQDRRNYRVSTGRMKSEGFQTRLQVGQGAEEIIEAIITGQIPDPESIYYRNAKWLKELTQIGSKDHRDVVALMETLSHLQPPQR
jgi:hypothetical protein